METIYWKRHSKEPFIIPRKCTVAPDAVTTPDILEVNKILYIYVGAVDSSVERLISFPLENISLKNKSPISPPSSAKIVLEPGPNDYDCFHVFDPAIVTWHDKTYLYYSAIGAQDDCIGLAISQDNSPFSKLDHPMLIGRSPEVILHNNSLYLFYVLKTHNQGYRIFAASSNNGLEFNPVHTSAVLSNGSQGEWDSYEVTTPRIFQKNKSFYMIYAGSHSKEWQDMPQSFGIARSNDLYNWEKYPYNPIFTLGEPGNWDDGAIWFGTVFEHKKTLYMVYEGGRLEDITNKTPALTRIGLASLSSTDFNEIVAKW